MQVRGASVTAFLSADRVEARLLRGMFHRTLVDTVTESVVRSEGSARSQAAIDTLDKIVRDRRWTGCALDVMLSDEFLRYALLPSLDARLDSAEIIGLAGAMFQRAYGDVAQTWTIRVCANGRRGALAAAMDGAIIGALNAMAAATECRLRATQPQFLHALANASRELSAASWVLLEEDAVAVIALVEAGALGAIRVKRMSASGEIVQALERERRRLGSEVRTLLVLNVDGADPALPEGWTVRRIATVAGSADAGAGSGTVYAIESGH